MNRRALFRGGGLAVAALVAAAVAVSAQQPRQTIAGGAQFHGYNFDSALGADVANLLLFPVALRVPVGERFRADLYAAWGRGAVEREGRVFELEGLVDTRLRASYQARPWAVVTLAVTLPTGNSEHDEAEALVSSVLATDILGFRESTFGTGTSVTGGIATVHELGDWNLGLAGSYRFSDEFEPRSDTTLSYEPGNEVRLRVAADRNIGEGTKLTVGGTFQNFDADQVSGRNLFQAGNRLRADASLVFRTGRATWTAYASEVYREQGDLTLDIVDGSGTVVGDTAITTGSQNLVIAGVAGSVPVFGTYRVRPQVDFRLQTREDDTGSGWILGFGGDVPLRLYRSYDVFPRARFLFGTLKDVEGLRQGFWGGEFGLTVRFSR